MAAKPTYLTIENGVKFSTLLIGGCSLYFGLMSEIRNMNTITTKDKEMTDYRLTQLEKCCNDKRNERKFVYNQSQAILPNEIEIKE